MEKSEFLKQIENLPAEVLALVNEVTNDPKFKDLEEGDHIVTIADLKMLDSRQKDWKGTLKDNLPEYKDYTMQVGMRLVSTEGHGSIIVRQALAGYLKMKNLTDKQIESGKFTAVGDEGNEYACITGKNGELERVISEDAMEGVRNIKAQIAHAIGKTGKEFLTGLAEAAEEKVSFGIRVTDEIYPGNGKIYSKVTQFFPAKVTADTAVDLTDVG